MEIVTHIQANRRSKLLLFIVLSLLLFAFADTPPRIDVNHFKKKDALTAYLTELFDAIDADPLYYTSNIDAVWNTIWRTPATTEEATAYFDLLTNAAYHLLQQGMIPASSKYYEKALPFYKADMKNAAYQYSYIEYICKPLGNNYTRMGDFEKALHIQRLALNAAVNNRLEEELPALYSNLATTYFWMQAYDSALTITNQGLNRVTEKDPVRLLLSNLKSEIFIEKNQLDSATNWNEKALALGYQYFPQIGWLTTSLVDKGDLLIHQQKAAEALHYYTKAWKLADKGNVREAAKIANKLGFCYQSLKKDSTAITWFKAALQKFNINKEGLYPDFTVTTSLFGIAGALENMAAMDSALLWYERAVVNDYYTQQLIGGTFNSRTSMYENERNTEQGIRLCHQLFTIYKKESYLQKALWLTELSKGRKLLFAQQRTHRWEEDSLLENNKTLFENLRNDYVLLAEATTESAKSPIRKRIRDAEYDLSLKDNNLTELLSPPSFNTFMNGLLKNGVGKTYISYYIGEKNAFGVFLNQGKYQHIVLSDAVLSKLTNATQLFITTYFSKDQNAFNNAPGTYSIRAYQLLQQWLPANFVTTEEVVITPDGILHQLPFEALTESKTNLAYWGEQHSISYQYSLLQQPTPAVDSRRKIPLQLFRFDKPHLGFPALPATQKESYFLQKKYATTLCHADTVTAATFIRALQSGSVLHIGTHAIAGDGDQQPYLVLKKKFNLGQLEYVTSNCPLVILAACETGKGVLEKNEGLQSIGRAFISKGVTGVISSRWEIDDAITSRLMQLFYTELSNVKLPSKALQRAERLFIQEQKTIAGKNPRFWCGLYYQGLNDPINLRQSPSHLLPVIIGLICVVSIVSFSIYKKCKRRSAVNQFL